MSKDNKVFEGAHGFDCCEIDCKLETLIISKLGIDCSKMKCTQLFAQPLDRCRLNFTPTSDFRNLLKSNIIIFICGGRNVTLSGVGC